MARWSTCSQTNMEDKSYFPAHSPDNRFGCCQLSTPLPPRPSRVLTQIKDADCDPVVGIMSRVFRAEGRGYFSPYLSHQTSGGLLLQTCPPLVASRRPGRSMKACFVVRDHSGQKLGMSISRTSRGGDRRRSYRRAMKTRRIAAPSYPEGRASVSLSIPASKEAR
jgi:hypothetical protein